MSLLGLNAVIVPQRPMPPNTHVHKTKTPRHNHCKVHTVGWFCQFQSSIWSNCWKVAAMDRTKTAQLQQISLRCRVENASTVNVCTMENHNCLGLPHARNLWLISVPLEWHLLALCSKHELPPQRNMKQTSPLRDECLGKSGPWRFVCHDYWESPICGGKSAIILCNVLGLCSTHMRTPRFVRPPKPSHLVCIFTSPFRGNRCGQNRYTENPCKSAPCFRPFWHHACIGFWPRWPVSVSRPKLPEQFFDWQCFQQSFVLLACFEQVRLWGGDARNEHQRITHEHALENTLNGSYQILSQLQTGNFGLSPSLKLGPKYCDSCCLMIQYSCLDNYILCFSVITRIYLVSFLSLMKQLVVTGRQTITVATMVEA